MIVTITDDFDLHRIAESGQCFRWTRADDNTYRILHANQCLYLTALGDHRFLFGCDENEYHAVWEPYFDLNQSYRAIRSRIDSREDPFLWNAAEQEKGIRILRQDPWEMLISFIISQNRNIPAIQRSIELLAGICGAKHFDSRGEEYHAFPTPTGIATLSENQLKECRLGYRWKYIHAAATSILDGQINLDMLHDCRCDDSSRTLCCLYGVGPKVASCVSLFGLHHLDAFPRDVWINRVLANEYPNGYPFERYSPFNGVYQQYMFAYYRHKCKNDEHRSARRIQGNNIKECDHL